MKQTEKFTNLVPLTKPELVDVQGGIDGIPLPERYRGGQTREEIERFLDELRMRDRMQGY